MSERIDNLPELNPFTRRLPKTPVLFGVLLLACMLMGISAVALINGIARLGTYALLADGVITGILIIVLPALLTIILVKSLRRYINSKYIFFVVMIGAFSYGIFINVGSAVYAVFDAYVIAEVIILVGNASIFAWWFFVDKLLLGQHRRASLLALVQPTLNALLYIPYSRFILEFNTPLSELLLKLYAGIGVFLVVSYVITSVLERPIKRSIGMRSIMDAVSQMLQNWLFGINISKPFGSSFGTPFDVATHTIAIKGARDGALKALFFVPEIHYGPAGTLGGSNFPYMLERYAAQKYRVPSFIMHSAVNIDRNPVSASQLAQLRQALDGGVLACKRGSGAFSYSAASSRGARVIRLRLGNVNLLTMTRAPRVTEDVAPEAAQLFRAVLETKFGSTVLVEAHNSRYESAPKEELAGVGPHSRLARDFSSAISLLDGAEHRGAGMRAGFASVEIYNKLGRPVDLADGNLNVAVFGINGFKYAMLQFNANNMLPHLRDAILRHIMQVYGIDAEVYTTDTHAVNSFGLSEDNEMGKHVKYAKLEAIIDAAMSKALSGMAPAKAYYGEHLMERFPVWGPNTMEKLTTAINTVIELARLFVPVVVAAGFIAAAWVILLV